MKLLLILLHNDNTNNITDADITDADISLDLCFEVVRGSHIVQCQQIVISSHVRLNAISDEIIINLHIVNTEIHIMLVHE